MTTSQQINSAINNDITIKNTSTNSIKESGIFFNNMPLENEKNKSKGLTQSSNPYLNQLNNINLGNSISPFGDNPIFEKDEKEENSSGNASKQNSRNKNIDSSKNSNVNNNFEGIGLEYDDNEVENSIGAEYMDGDEDEKEEKKEKKEEDKNKKEKEKNNMKKSDLKSSYNFNTFESLI